jgi:septum site-determining protein MinD
MAHSTPENVTPTVDSLTTAGATLKDTSVMATSPDAPTLPLEPSIDSRETTSVDITSETPEALSNVVSIASSSASEKSSPKADREPGEGRVIVVTSGKGGVGKTTASANVGTGLARLGYSVVLVDTDIGLRNLDILMGLENRIVYNLIDVIEGRCKLNQAMVKDKRMPNLSLLAAAQTRDKSALDEEKMQDLIGQLRKKVDFIIIDSPAGIEQGFQNAVTAADEAIVVVNPEMSSIRDADRIIGLLETRENVKHYKLIINRMRPAMVRSHDMMDIDDVLEILSIKLLGVVPEDPSIIVSTNRGEPIVLDEQSTAGQAYRNIARRVAGEDVPFLNLEEPQGIFERIKNLFRSSKVSAF